MGLNSGVMGAISLALDYLFAIEDQPHLIVKEGGVWDEIK
jgi:hypothetical protein